jgi:hypothetical protein
MSFGEKYLAPMGKMDAGKRPMQEQDTEGSTEWLFHHGHEQHQDETPNLKIRFARQMGTFNIFHATRRES